MSRDRDEDLEWRLAGEGLLGIYQHSTKRGSIAPRPREMSEEDRELRLASEGLLNRYWENKFK